MKTPEEITAGLAQFTGSERQYKHIFGLRYTEGVKYVAEECGAYWLLDLINSYQGRCKRDPRLSEIQFWTLTVTVGKNGRRRAVAQCDYDEGQKAFAQRISVTDFPLSEIKIWVENDTMYLPSER